MYQGNLREAFQDHHTNMSIGGRLLRTTSLMAGRSRELQDLADSLAVEIGREKSELILNAAGHILPLAFYLRPVMRPWHYLYVKSLLYSLSNSSWSDMRISWLSDIFFSETTPAPKAKSSLTSGTGQKRSVKPVFCLEKQNVITERSVFEVKCKPWWSAIFSRNRCHYFGSNTLMYIIVCYTY